jgi:hypothetical protein
VSFFDGLDQLQDEATFSTDDPVVAEAIQALRRDMTRISLEVFAFGAPRGDDGEPDFDHDPPDPL